MKSLKNYTIRKEQASDYFEVENATREAFWNVYRPGCLEHLVLHELRMSPDFIPELDYVMTIDNIIVGQVICVKANLACSNGTVVPIMTLGPISIIPEYQRKGYGKVLLDFVLEKATQLGFGAVCFEGNIDFYGKSGFVLASSKNIHYYAEPTDSVVPYFLLKELTPNYLDGIEAVYTTPSGYFVDESKIDEFDKQFTPKQKLKLPGQLF